MAGALGWDPGTLGPWNPGTLAPPLDAPLLMDLLMMALLMALSLQGSNVCSSRRVAAACGRARCPVGSRLSGITESSSSLVWQQA